MSVSYWIGDSFNQVMRFVNTSGIISTPSLSSTDTLFTGNGGFASIGAVCTDTKGNVYVTDTTACASDSALYQISPTLNVVTIAGCASGTLPPLAAFSFSGFVQAAACDKAGNIYLGDTANSKIWIINMQATTQTLLGQVITSKNIGSITWTHLTQPTELWLDASGNLFVGDQGNGAAAPNGTSSVVWKVTTAGANSILAGSQTSNGFSGDGGAATSAKLNGPFCANLDAAGNIYISDTVNACIRAVNTQATTQTLFNVSIGAGNIQTIAGIPGSAGFSGNGGQATSAKIGFASGSPIGAWNCVIGPDGNLYIVDTDNFQIRMVNSAGIISAAAGNGTRGYVDNVAAPSGEIGTVRGGLAFVQTTYCGGVTGSPQAGNPLI